MGDPWISIALLLLVYKNSGIFIADAGDQMFVCMVIMHLELVASTLVRMYLKGKKEILTWGSYEAAPFPSAVNSTYSRKIHLHKN